MRTWMKRAVPAALVAGSLLALVAGTASASTPLPFTPDPAAVVDVVTNAASVLDATKGTSILPAEQERSFGPNLLSNVDLHQLSLSGQNIGGGPLESLALPKLPVKLPVSLPGAADDGRSLASAPHPGLNILDPAKLAALQGIPGLTATMLPNIAVDGPLPTNMLSGVDQVSELTAVPGQSGDARALVPAVPAVPSLTAVTGLLNKAPKLG